MKKLIIATAFVVAATSAALAQGVYAAPGYGGYGGGYYDYAPGYGNSYGSSYGYRGYGNSARDDERGGPGPRVGAGGGMGIGSQR